MFVERLQALENGADEQGADGVRVRVEFNAKQCASGKKTPSKSHHHAHKKLQRAPEFLVILRVFLISNTSIRLTLWQ
jgi:hypothetical protein